MAWYSIVDPCILSVLALNSQLFTSLIKSSTTPATMFSASAAVYVLSDPALHIIMSSCSAEFQLQIFNSLKAAKGGWELGPTERHGLETDPCRLFFV
jgi:hypothetical protein